MICLEKLIVKERKGKENTLTCLRKFSLFGIALLAVLALIAGPAVAQQKKPNILVIMGDDIGQSNISSVIPSFHAASVGLRLLADAR
jgi:hypothetical protein